MFSVLTGIIPLSLRNGGHLIPFAPFPPIVCKCGATAPSPPGSAAYDPKPPSAAFAWDGAISSLWPRIP